MIKSILKFITIFALFFSSFSQAGIIICSDTPDKCLNSDVISSEFYITKGSYQWVWASSVNTQFAYGINELKAPTFHDDGWRYAETTDELLALSLLTLANFTNSNGSFIEATTYWNTVFHGVNEQDLSDGLVSSLWVDGNSPLFFHETFYVRDVQVPEPSTIMIFAIALIALSIRKRAIK